MSTFTHTQHQRNAPIAAALLALTLRCLPANSAGVDATADETYTWSAELVSVDAQTNTAVVQARVESHAEIAGLDSFSEGDRLTLSWTGRHWAAGIRGLDANATLAPDTLSLPVEFVSAERDGRYIRFRVPVPDQNYARISTLEAGAWVTGTSPKTGTDWTMGVHSMRPYNDTD